MHSAARSAQALALGRRDLDPRRGSLLVRSGPGVLRYAATLDPGEIAPTLGGGLLSLSS